MGASTLKMNFPAKVLIFCEPAENSTNFDGLTPVFLDVFVPQTSRFTLFSLYALSLRSRFRFSAYATSTAALYAATLSATTILPRKARRDPTYVFEYDASLYALAHDTPPYAFA